jgi:hypothetical protein
VIKTKLTKRTVVIDLEVETDQTLPDEIGHLLSIEPDRARVTIEDGFVMDIKVAGLRVYANGTPARSVRRGQSLWTARTDAPGRSMIGDVPAVIDEIHTAALEANWQAERDDMADGEELAGQTVTPVEPADK